MCFIAFSMIDHVLDVDFDHEGFAKRLADAMFPEKVTAFSARAGIPQPTVSKYLRSGGSAGPRLDIVARMADALGVSIDWLVWGRGDGVTASGEVIRVPRYEATLAAGAGSWNDGRRRLDDIPFTQAFFQKRLGRPTGAGFSVLTARGDSMEPGISDGDLLLIDEMDNRLTDGVLAFVLDDEARVKRFRRRIDGVTILSDNPAYGPEDLSADQLGRISIIGRVRWVGRVL